MFSVMYKKLMKGNGSPMGNVPNVGQTDIEGMRRVGPL
jgi:hypothetical protein